MGVKKTFSSRRDIGLSTKLVKVDKKISILYYKSKCLLQREMLT